MGSVYRRKVKVCTICDRRLDTAVARHACEAAVCGTSPSGLAFLKLIYRFAPPHANGRIFGIRAQLVACETICTELDR